MNELNTYQKLALVVDDSAMQCKLLSVLLQEEGYRVVTALNGAIGVDKYIIHRPDLVLMDINMPVMNGYQAAREIKKLSKNTLAPLIFITSLNTDKAFIESIEAGGDGILVRPFAPEVFKAKIKSIQRISDLYSQVKQLQQEQQQDAELAEKLMSEVIEARNFSTDRIQIIKQAATLFSGDIQLSALCPNGDVNVLLGDFTGHGLRSSIGAIPLSETFRAMTKKGFSLHEIIAQINRQLFRLLPQDLFLAAAFVCISAHNKSAYIFNAGLPDVYIINDGGEIRDTIASCHPPLGVIKKLIPEIPLVIKAVTENDNIVMISDGIVEARNLKGEMFEQQRFEKAIIEGAKQNNIANLLIEHVNLFCENMLQEDDLSIIEIPCGGWEPKSFSSSVDSLEVGEQVSFTEKSDWLCSLSLTAVTLASVNPIPIIMNQIKEIEGGAGEHWQIIYTIFTELYVNALEHGILSLDSRLKQSAEGFSEYFNEKQLRLSQLDFGEIDIYVELFYLKNFSKVVLKIKDSGKGFDVLEQEKLSDSHVINQGLSGRGIQLVKQLATKLNYYDNGTLVEATYLWEKS